MTDIRAMVQNAITGRHEPDLPAGVRGNVERLRHRLLTELPSFQPSTMSLEEFEAAWQVAVNRIFDESEQALAMQKGPKNG
jgi:hypothetical protein